MTNLSSLRPSGRDPYFQFSPRPTESSLGRKTEIPCTIGVLSLKTMAQGLPNASALLGTLQNSTCL